MIKPDLHVREIGLELVVVAILVVPATQRPRQEDPEFKVSLSNSARTCLKI